MLARRTGRTISEVVAERQRRRIEPGLPPYSWTAYETKMLGRYSDTSELVSAAIQYRSLDRNCGFKSK